VSVDSGRAHAPPAKKEQVCAERPVRVAGGIGRDVNAVRQSVRAVERRRPTVYGAVAAERSFVTRGVVRREMAAGHD
jgi:hypothetical protein